MGRAGMRVSSSSSTVSHRGIVRSITSTAISRGATPTTGSRGSRDKWPLGERLRGRGGELASCTSLHKAQEPVRQHEECTRG